MKQFIFSCCVIPFAIIAAFNCSEASAQVLASDNFDYANGSLVPNGGWINGGGTPGDFLVTGNQAVVQHGIPSEDVNLAFTPQAGDLYYGLDFSVSSSGQILGTDAEYFAHFKDGGFGFAARLDVSQAAGGGDFTVGIASDTSSTDTLWGSDLSFGTTYRAVVKYDQVSNIAQLWIDAALSTDTSVLGFDQADPGDTIEAFALRQSDSDLNETVFVDNLVIGGTFADVVNPVTSTVPEPGSAAILALFAGVGMLRRRR